MKCNSPPAALPGPVNCLQILEPVGPDSKTSWARPFLLLLRDLGERRGWQRLLVHRKDLISEKSCIHLKGKNTNNQKPQLKRVRRPEGGIPIPRNSRAQQRRRLFSPARTQPMKSHELFISPSPPNFLFPSIKVLPIIKVFSLPRYAGTCLWLTMFADSDAILCRS